MTARLSYLPSFAFAPTGTIGTVEFSNTLYTYNLPLSATWELDIFGKIRNKKMAAKAAYMQSKEYIQAVRTQLISTTANVYYTLLMLDAQYEIVCKTETIWKESVEATRALKDAGYVNETALAQTEANYFSVVAGKLDLQEQINKTENTLSLLLFNTPSHIERGKLSEQDFTEEFKLGIPLLLLSNRPDVKMAELSLAQAFYATNSARAAFYPSISLQGVLGWTNSANGVALDPLTMIGSAIGSLTMPLFNRGANIAQLKIAKAQQEEAKLTFTKTLLSAGKEVNEALTKYQTAHNKAELYKQQIESLSSAAESTALLMKYGSTNYLEVLVAQQTLLQAQLNQVANRLAEIQGLVTLYNALGGGRE
jgi:NodT family efflux transporter outer membrane factor (OMF) lipoprotein